MRPRKEDLEIVYGYSAVQAAYAARAADVVKIVYTEAMRREVTDLLRDAAKRRIAYREESADSLARMTDAVHHEGVCLWLKPRPASNLEAAMAMLKPGQLAMALDGIDNPHNVGAIVRSAAYFGVPWVLVENRTASRLTPAATRIAEGGAEYVGFVAVPDLALALTSVSRAGIGVIGTDARAPLKLDALQWPKRSLIVLGNERHGLSETVRRAVDTLVSIPGSGHLDSLNVSVAAGVLISAHALRK